MPTQTKFICPSGVTNVDFSGVFAELNGGSQHGTATNFKVNGLDLTGIFHASTSANDRASFNTGYKVNSTDLSSIFRRRGYLEDPIITAQPATVTRTTTQSATFTVQFTCTTNVNYQWKKNAINIAGYSGNVSAGSQTLSYPINSVAMGNEGNYSITLTGLEVVSTNNARLNISPRIISTAAAPGTYPLFYGTQNSDTLNLQITSADGEAPLSYQWLKNTSTLVSSAAQYTKTVVSSDSGTYACVVTNSYGTATTGNFIINALNGVPIISSGPSNQIIVNGNTAAFSVSASANGAVLSYQWKKDGNNIANANSPSYSIAGATTSDDGSYTCGINTTYGSVTSNAAISRIKPFITAHPSSAQLNEGNAASVTVAAGGSPTLSYQWYGPNSSIINGATSASYSFSLSSANDGGYFCQVKSTYDAVGVTSDTATISIITPVVSIGITNFASPFIFPLNTSVTIIATPTQGANISYQWYGPNGAISGATNINYIFPLSASNDGAYYVVATNGGGSYTSNTINVYVHPYITTHPASTTVNAGTNAIFTVVAQGSGTLAYQWYRNGSLIIGGTLSSHAESTTASSNQYTFYCVVSSTITNVTTTPVTSTTATLTVNYAPIITDHPDSVVLNNGNATSFTVAATAQPAVSTYQWQRSTNNGSSWANLGAGDETSISGITGVTLTFVNQGSRAGYQYRCAVTNSVGTTHSNAAILYINPYIISQPSSTVAYSGNNAVFSVTAGGSPTLSYQWYRNGSLISGATSSSHAEYTTSSSNGYTFYCIVSSNASGTSPITSSTATLTAIWIPTYATISGGSTTYNDTDSVTLTHTANDGNAAITSRQWYSWNGTAFVVINGQTSSSITFSAGNYTGTPDAMGGGVYRYYYTIRLQNPAGYTDPQNDNDFGVYFDIQT